MLFAFVSDPISPYPSQEPTPARVLEENQYLLPKQGRALDLVCGRGGNAIFLAEHGLETHAWDISEIVINQLNQTASKLKLQLHTQQRDVVKSPPEAGSFDVIIVSRFLERKNYSKNNRSSSSKWINFLSDLHPG